MTTAIKIESVSKLYRLGTVGTGTMAHDLNRWWHQIRGKEDPYAKVGQLNDRTQSSTNDQGQKTKDGAAPDYVWALRDINLEVQQGEILGIIGRNGAGKSTLLKLLSRVTAPTTGSIKTKGRIASLLEVGTGFHPELTGRENIYINGAILGMKRHEITRQLAEIVEFSGCAKYLDTPVKRYSSGMMIRLGFAVAAHLRCEIMIVDEVLAVGDLEFQSKCIGKMKDVGQTGRTILFVSHNLASVRKLCTTGVLMDQGTLSAPIPIEDVISAYTDCFVLSEAVVDLDISKADQSFGCATKVEILDEHGKPTTSLSACRPWGMRIHVTVARQLTHFIVGWGLTTETETPCRNSWMEPIAISEGNYVIEIRDKDVQLSRGRYILKIGLSEKEQPFHYIDAASIELLAGDEVLTRFSIPGVTINPSLFHVSRVD